MFQRRRVPTQTTSVKTFRLRLFLQTSQTILQQSCKRAFERYFCEVVFFFSVGSKLPELQFDLCRLLLGNSAIYFESGPGTIAYRLLLYVNRSLSCHCHSALTMLLPVLPISPLSLAPLYHGDYLTEIPAKILLFCAEKHLIIPNKGEA